LVIRPTWRPSSGANLDCASTSSPLITLWFLGPRPRPSAATVAIVLRHSLMLRPPFGWTRLVMITRNDLLVGSIHNAGPVKPVWPYEVPRGKILPRLDEYCESMSQPSPRRIG